MKMIQDVHGPPLEKMRSCYEKFSVLLRIFFLKSAGHPSVCFFIVSSFQWHFTDHGKFPVSVTMENFPWSVLFSSCRRHAQEWPWKRSLAWKNVISKADHVFHGHPGSFSWQCCQQLAVGKTAMEVECKWNLKISEWQFLQWLAAEKIAINMIYDVKIVHLQFVLLLSSL